MIEIQELKLENWKELRDLFLRLLKNDPEAFVDDYDDIALRSEEDWVKSLQRRGKTYVAVDNGNYVGMGRINFYDEIPDVPVLHKLGVLPEYRGQGIARKLIAAREEWAKAEGAKKVRLYVMADREKTIKFSKDNGYTITEILKGDVKRKDGTWADVVIMEKDI